MTSAVTHAGSAELSTRRSRRLLRSQRWPPKTFSRGANLSARRSETEQADSAGPPSIAITARTRSG